MFCFWAHAADSSLMLDSTAQNSSFWQSWSDKSINWARRIIVINFDHLQNISVIFYTMGDLTVYLLSLRPASVERKPPELSTLNDGYQIRIWSPTSPPSHPKSVQPSQPPWSKSLYLPPKFLGEASLQLDLSQMRWMLNTRKYVTRAFLSRKNFLETETKKWQLVYLNTSWWALFTRLVAMNPWQQPHYHTQPERGCSFFYTDTFHSCSQSAYPLTYRFPTLQSTGSKKLKGREPSCPDSRCNQIFLWLQWPCVLEKGHNRKWIHQYKIVERILLRLKETLSSDGRVPTKRC